MCKHVALAVLRYTDCSLFLLTFQTGTSRPSGSGSPDQGVARQIISASFPHYMPPTYFAIHFRSVVVLIAQRHPSCIAQSSKMRHQYLLLIISQSTVVNSCQNGHRCTHAILPLDNSFITDSRTMPQTSFSFLT